MFVPAIMPKPDTDTAHTHTHAHIERGRQLNDITHMATMGRIATNRTEPKRTKQNRTETEKLVS